MTRGRSLRIGESNGLDLAEGVDEKTRNLILQPLQTAVAKAVEKAKPKDQGPEAPTLAP
jgi:hypothetical protein